jgi:hypothetical protein
MAMIVSGSDGLEFPDGSDQTSAFTGNAASITTGVLAQANGGTGTTIGYNGFKNRIINGDMRIDQRNAGASGTAIGVYTVDRWAYLASTSSKLTWQQNAGSVTPPVGFVNYLGITSSSSYSVPSGEVYEIEQRIEGLNVSDFGWGTVNATTITINFWVRSSLTGTFGGALVNSAGDRSYPFSYTISSANTWEQKSVTIAGDTTGTWLTTNGIGIYLRISLGAGSSLSGTAGAWTTGNLYSVTGATSVVGTDGATFYITGVQLEKGATATSFDYLDYGRQLQQCQRYYETAYVACSAGSTGFGGNSYWNSVLYKVQKRATATITLKDAIGGSGVTIWKNATQYNGVAADFEMNDTYSFQAVSTGSQTDAGMARFTFLATAEL